MTRGRRYTARREPKLGMLQLLNLRQCVQPILRHLVLADSIDDPII